MSEKRVKNEQWYVKDLFNKICEENEKLFIENFIKVLFY